jgi:hypothetical protein
MTPANLKSLKELKNQDDGERVIFRARVLRFWEVGALRMALVGDESALVRIEIGDAALQEKRSYEFRDAVVRTYPGGWHSVALTEGSTLSALEEAVPVSQSDEYIERTYKILAGIQRKKGRTAGRLPPWAHPTTGSREKD